MQFAVGMLFSTDERYDRIHNHAVNFPAVDPTGIAVFTSARSEHEDSNDNKGQRFCHTRGLIIAGYDDACYRRLAANHVDTRLLTIAVRYATDSGLGVLFDFSFGLGSAVPWAEEEATVLNTLLEFVIVVTFVDVLVAELSSLFKDIFLCKLNPGRILFPSLYAFCHRIVTLLLAIILYFLSFFLVIGKPQLLQIPFISAPHLGHFIFIPPNLFSLQMLQLFF